jgi:hypothetical protein
MPTIIAYGCECLVVFVFLFSFLTPFVERNNGGRMRSRESSPKVTVGENAVQICLVSPTLWLPKFRGSAEANWDLQLYRHKQIHPRWVKCPLLGRRH